MVLRFVCTSVLSGALIVLGVSKLVGGHEESMWVGSYAYYSLASLEMLAGVLLWTRARAAINGIVLVGLVCAATFHLLIGPIQGNCGCLGAWSEIRGANLLVIGGLGFV